MIYQDLIPTVYDMQLMSAEEWAATERLLREYPGSYRDWREALDDVRAGA